MIKNMIFKKIIRITLAACIIAATAICAANAANIKNDRTDTLFQVATLNSLMLGLYDGVVSAKDFLAHGDTGLGTFDKLDGEMIVLDGVAYQIKADGTTTKAVESKTIPFGVTAPFKTTWQAEVTALSGIEALKSYLNKNVAINKNRIYIIKLTGDFPSLRARSVPAQEKPYLPLSEITKNQSEFKFEPVSGTIVGVYFPDYFANFNMPGWHFHFISKDRTRGGHVLETNIAKAMLQTAEINSFKIFLPGTQEFAAAGLASDLKEDISKVEQ